MCFKLSTAYGHKIYRSTQGNQNFTSPESPLCKLNLSSRKTLQKKKVLAWASSLESSFFSSSSNNPLNLATCGESRHLILIKISKSAPSTHEKWTIQFTFTSVADPTSRPKQIKFGLLSCLGQKKKRDDHDVVNIHTHKERNAPKMHPTKRQFVLSSVIALFRFALTVLLLRNQNGVQIAKNLCTTHSDYHLLQFNTCNENSSIHQNQKSKRNSHYRFAHSLLCGGCALKLSTATRSTDLQKESKFHFSIISPLQTEPI